jgi:uncharacterized membrane protein HdeD (DUF308 family)
VAEPIDPRQALRQISGLWWLTLLLGVLGVIAGIIVIARPDKSLAALAVVTGIFVLIDGVVALASSLTHESDNRVLAAIVGVVSLIVGVLLIRHPTHSVQAIALLFGLWLLAMGAVRLILAIGVPARRGWHVVIAAVEAIAGIVIVASPSIGVATLALLVGLSLIINGACFAALGVVLRAASKGDEPPGSSGPPAAA